MHLKNNILIKSGANYSIASTCSALCTMVIGFLNMRWLGPELLGIWQSITIINLYLPIVQLGIQSGLNLELPILIGNNNKEKAKSLVQTALSFAVILSIIFTIISLIVIAILFSHHTDKKILAGVIAVCSMAVFSCFRLHYIATYRSANAFNQLAKIYWIDIVIMIIMIYFIYKYHYYGMILYQIVKDLAFTILMYIFAPYRTIKPKFYKEQFIILLKRGVFMTLFNQLKNIIESIPRLVLLKFGGVTYVGLFNPALVMGTFMNLLPGQIGQFLHPQFGMKYGQTKQAKDMWPYFQKITLIVPICLLPVVVLGWSIIPYFLEFFFPKYLLSLWPIRILMIGFLFSSSYLSRGFLITIKAYKEVIGLQLLELVLFGGLSIIMVYYNPKNILISLSIAMSVSYLVSYFVNFIVVKKTIFKPQYN